MMKKLVLMGNPNVGKSVIFTRLTGTRVITSNYPGTTVDFAEGQTHTDTEHYVIIDAPGTYSLEPANPAEEVAVRILEDANIIVNVIDATNLERNLYLTLELLVKQRPVIIVLNLWDEAQHTGILIDAIKMEQILKVPVVCTIALTGEGIRHLVKRIPDACLCDGIKPLDESGRWQTIGQIVKMVQRVEHKHHRLQEKIVDLTIKPFTGILFAVLTMGALFFVIRMLGESLIHYLAEPFFECYRPFITRLGSSLAPGLVHDILIGRLIDGRIDFVQSMGILTTGLYVPFGMVLPYIIAFYALLGLLEDSGYLPRLATLTDTVFHRLGMHGHGIVPLVMGLGCNVPGALATRILETNKQRFIAATLISISVPCMAKTAMIFGVLGPYGTWYILAVFGVMATAYLMTGFIMNKCIPGESREIFLEIPPYRRPSLRAVSKKTWMRVRSFLAEAIPYLFAGVFCVNLFYATGIIERLGNLLSPVIQGWLGLPREAAGVLLMGFLRKDLAVGMLIPLGMTPGQLLIAVTTLTMSFPCVGVFAVLLKELGIKYLALAMCIMIAVAFLMGGIMKLFLKTVAAI